MKSIFEQADNAELIDRIEQLTPSSTPQWGKMNVAQMLAHCQVPLQVALGELQLKRGLVGFLFGSIAKKKLLGDEGFKPNMPTFSQAKTFGQQRDFKAEKQKLIEMVQRLTSGPEVITREPHPFFGSLTVAEWDALQYKHLDHHLRQFGV